MAPIEVQNWTSDYYIANETSCQQILENPDALRKIPLLNNIRLQDVADKQLVRFRGMVQDMYNPEYYYFKFKRFEDLNIGENDVSCGTCTDATRCSLHQEVESFDSIKNENGERQIYVVISIPGLNDWAKESSTNVQKVNPRTHNGKKNTNDDSEKMDCSEPTTKKAKVTTNDDVNNGSTSKVGCVSEEHILNFPIPIDDGKACIVKVYDGMVLKLNQVIDVIGFISLDPTLGMIHDSTMNEAEASTHHPPPSLVPRLHAVKIIQLTKAEIANVPEIISKAELIRSDLHIILSQLLFGDHLAADYVICHLLSTIFVRKDSLCLGTFPLNITNFPASKRDTFPKEFYNFLKLIVRKSHFLEMTLENLNELALVPKKDYECDRLTSGILQLSDNTHLVIDETGLTTGELTVTGKGNYGALSDLLMFQKLTYDFKYYTLEYETNIPVLIFSDVKSFIPCPMRVVLNVDADSENLYSQVMEAAHQYLKNENRLANIRQYLEALRHAEFTINDDLTEVIKKDFVEMRRTNMTVDNMHTLMVLARFISLSYGQTALDMECWKKSVQLETERLSRLPQRG